MRGPRASTTRPTNGLRMAEMRKPRDFWKAAALAQFFCYFCYMLFGIIVYSYQGQYASILPNLDFQNDTLILANVKLPQDVFEPCSRKMITRRKLEQKTSHPIAE